MELLLPPDAPIQLAIDETLTRRRGPKVFAASWWHDGSAAGTKKIGYGNSWVVLAIVVTLPFCRRPIALPILFALCAKGGRSKPDLGRDLLDEIAEAFPTRTIHLVGDAAYGAGHFAGLGQDITMTTRARSNAVFCHPTPPASGKRGRPRLRGERIGTPTDIADQATKDNNWVDTLINRYGTTITARTTEITGLWFGVWRTDPVRVILVKDSRRKATNKRSYDIAIVTTDMTATAAEIIARYASRWSIEVCFHDGKNITGVGETQNRVEEGSRTQRPLHIHGPDLSSSTLYGTDSPRYLASRAACQRPASGLRHDTRLVGRSFGWCWWASTWSSGWRCCNRICSRVFHCRRSRSRRACRCGRLGGGWRPTGPAAQTD